MVTRTRLRVISLFAQVYALKRVFPDSYASVKRNRLKWTGAMSPSPLSETYTVRLHYSLEKSPRVFVDAPPLVDKGSKSVQHRYADGSLCLYLPGAREWGRDMLLVDTVVPWASEWLLHYEIWLATGEWHGGGIHPGGRGKLVTDDQD